MECGLRTHSGLYPACASLRRRTVETSRQHEEQHEQRILNSLQHYRQNNFSAANIRSFPLKSYLSDEKMHKMMNFGYKSITNLVKRQM